MLLPCEHTVCKECIIEKESQGLEIECFYDNCTIAGIYDVATNMKILKKLLKEDQNALDKQVVDKIDNARAVDIDNPAALITR